MYLAKVNVELYIIYLFYLNYMGLVAHRDTIWIPEWTP